MQRQIQAQACSNLSYQVVSHPSTIRISNKLQLKDSLETIPSKMSTCLQNEETNTVRFFFRTSHLIYVCSEMALAGLFNLPSPWNRKITPYIASGYIFYATKNREDTGLVVGAVPWGRKRPGFNSSSSQKIFLSSGARMELETKICQTSTLITRALQLYAKPNSTLLNRVIWSYVLVFV